MFICKNISKKGSSLYFAGVSVEELANKYGTPLYIMDENRIRENIKTYVDSLRLYFGGNAIPLFASKSCSFKQIYRIMKEEGIGIDVVSIGEIYTAKEAGFDLKKSYFHGNNKTRQDIEFAISNGVGVFVVDNEDELTLLNEVAKEKGLNQEILIRITPGIDTHTYEAVNTGKVDSKFGNAIKTGLADSIVKKAISLSNVTLSGFHCHLGSQVFEEDVFERGAKIMIDFISHVKEDYGIEISKLNLGGGFGVRYVESDPIINIDKKIEEISKVVKGECEKKGLKVPFILLEPGRSIVADSGMTVYRVGSVKEIKDFKKYLSIDGGMGDNPRYALYKSKYTILPVSKMDLQFTEEYSVVGRCCESGDIIGENISLPKMEVGDLVAVLTTGAYNYSMASNYNRLLRPMVIMIKDGKDYVAVKRETLEYLVGLDV